MDVLHKPIVTEKMSKQGESLNCYGFFVDKRANKIEVKKAVEEMYGVTVVSVNTMRYGGKARQRFTSSGIQSGKTKSFKKAMITVAEGEQIDLYSAV